MKNITFVIMLFFSFYLFALDQKDVQFTGKIVKINSRTFFPFKINNMNKLYYAGSKIYVKIKEDENIDWLVSYSKSIGCTFIKDIKRSPNTFLFECSENFMQSYQVFRENKNLFDVEPDILIQINMKNYEDPYLPNEWHIFEEGSSVFSGWKLLESYGINPGSGVKVAVIDDGFDLSHEDLNGAFIKGFDFVDNDNFPDAYSYNNHGTAVTGIIASQINEKGCVGVSPYSRIIPVKISSDIIMSSDIADVFNFALDSGADVISNSWGPADGSGAVYMPQALQNIISDAAINGRDGKGVIIVFAAGNGNESISDENSYDGFAANENVISVGAVSREGRRAYYSDYGKDLDFMAPSCDLKSDDFYADWLTTSYDNGIWTTDLSGSSGYTDTEYTASFCGTSASAPILSGVIALMLSANKDLTLSEIYKLLKETSDKVDSLNASYDEDGHSIYYGYGRINALRALNTMISDYGLSVPESIDEDGYPLQDEDVMPENDVDFPESLINIEKEGCSCSFII